MPFESLHRWSNWSVPVSSHPTLSLSSLQPSFVSSLCAPSIPPSLIFFFILTSFPPLHASLPSLPPSLPASLIPFSTSPPPISLCFFYPLVHQPLSPSIFTSTHPNVWVWCFFPSSPWLCTYIFPSFAHFPSIFSHSLSLTPHLILPRLHPSLSSFPPLSFHLYSLFVQGLF